MRLRFQQVKELINRNLVYLTTLLKKPGLLRRANRLACSLPRLYLTLRTLVQGLFVTNSNILYQLKNSTIYVYSTFDCNPSRDLT